MRKAVIVIACGLIAFFGLVWWISARNSILHAVGVAQLSSKDAEVIEAVLRDLNSHPSDRIYFLTCTPMSEWDRLKGWVRLPEIFHQRIADIVPPYLPADGAYVSDGDVFQSGTDREAWMQWICIKRWISDKEVEVEDGVWRCNLGGGASSGIYEKVDGKWRFKKSTGGWVS